MKVEVVTPNRVKRLPQVGELWIHADGGRPYMRIQDVDGNKIQPTLDITDFFFSVDISTGELVWTDREEAGYIILEPVGGTLKLQLKEAK